jgi:hypothetical protein
LVVEGHGVRKRVAGNGSGSIMARNVAVDSSLNRRRSATPMAFFTLAVIVSVRATGLVAINVNG